MARITLSNAPDVNTGVIDRQTLSTLDRDFKALTDAIKSAVNKNSFLGTSEKHIDTNSGRAYMDVYVSKKDLKNALEAVNYKIGNLSTKATYEVSSNANKSSATLVTKETQESLRQGRRTLGKITAVLTLITDITRRILATIMSGASQAVKDARTAGNLGMDYSTVRKYSITEKAFGLESGTTMGAISTLQNKFGNIPSLDEKALESLALVMGGGVKEMVMSGMGGSSPEKLMESILNKYFSTAMNGYNSIGQYVGEQKARRELVSQLNKISPELSQLLSVMLDNATNSNSVYYGRFNNFSEFQALPQSNRLDLKDTDTRVYRIFGQYSDQLTSALNDLKDGLKTIFSEKFLGILERIANSRLFMESGKKIETDDKNYNLNLKSIEQMKAKRAEDSKVISDAIAGGDATTQRKFSALAGALRNNGVNPYIINEAGKAEDFEKNKEKIAEKYGTSVLVVEQAKEYFDLNKSQDVQRNVLADLEGLEMYINKAEKENTNASRGKAVNYVPYQPARVSLEGGKRYMKEALYKNKDWDTKWDNTDSYFRLIFKQSVDDMLNTSAGAQTRAYIETRFNELPWYRESTDSNKFYKLLFDGSHVKQASEVKKAVMKDFEDAIQETNDTSKDGDEVAKLDVIIHDGDSERKVSYLYSPEKGLEAENTSDSIIIDMTQASTSAQV